jgi:6-phosphogluconolactonase
MTWFRRLLPLAVAAFAAVTPPVPAAEKPGVHKSYVVYIGTYTGKGSQGIYAWKFSADDGSMAPLGLMAETSNPSFLALQPDGEHLFAVNEDHDYEGHSAGAVTSLAIDAATAKLRKLNQVSSGGADPCHLVVDPTGRFVIVANYTGGSIASFPIRSDGTLGPAATFIQHHGTSVNPARQEAAHAHDIALSNDNRYAIVCDLGMDKLMVYRFNAETGALTPNDPPFAAVKPGSGPRHFVFDARNKHGYVIDELASTVIVFDWDEAHGALQEKQTVPTLPASFHGQNTAAEIAIDPSGHFLYGSNRGHDSIAAFRIDEGDGTLKPVGRYSTEGKTPRSFAIDPTGQWLLAANQDTNTVQIFRINPKTGALAWTRRKVDVSQPVCVLFMETK